MSKTLGMKASYTNKWISASLSLQPGLHKACRLPERPPRPLLTLSLNDWWAWTAAEGLFKCLNTSWQRKYFIGFVGFLKINWEKCVFKKKKKVLWMKLTSQYEHQTFPHTEEWTRTKGNNAGINPSRNNSAGPPPRHKLGFPTLCEWDLGTPHKC